MSIYHFEEDSIQYQRRKFQALREFSKGDDPPNELMNYMELVIQSGYILLFGQFFALGSLFCMIANHI